jgi:acyl-CoA synthetase (AMP-forming)/AMP-acid ligase II
VVAGAHVCKSYYRSPEAERASKIVDPGGEIWHRMGDTVYRDGQGRLWLAGRVHSTIHRGGALLHAQLVEQAARGDDLRIRSAAALGLPDAVLGERLTVVLEAEEVDGLLPAVRSRLQAAGFAADELRVTRRPLPRDPRHRSKIDYARLRARLLRRRRGAAA